jgi:hypothetical protein
MFPIDRHGQRFEDIVASCDAIDRCFDAKTDPIVEGRQKGGPASALPINFH